MAATITAYDVFTQDIADVALSWGMQAYKIMILSNAYTPNLPGHTTRNDLTNEVTGTGYTAGGQALTGKSRTLDTMAHKTKFLADDAEWNPVTFTNARYAVIYRSNGGMATADPLLWLIDFGADENKSAAQFVIAWAAGVVFTINR